MRVHSSRHPYGATAVIPQLESFLGLPAGMIQAAVTAALKPFGLSSTASPLTTSQMDAIVTAEQAATWSSQQAEANDAAWQILNVTLAASGLIGKNPTGAFPYQQAIALAAKNSDTQQAADSTVAAAAATQKAGLADTIVVGYDRQGDPINAEGMNIPSAGSCQGVVSGYNSTGVAIDCNGILVPNAPPKAQSQAAIIPQITSVAPADNSWLYWLAGGAAVLGGGYWLLKRKKAAT